MFLFNRPSDKQIQRFLEDRQNDEFSYKEIGATRSTTPTGYNIDHNRTRLGHGPEDYERAKTAIRNWAMFEMPWIKLYPRDTPIEIGRNMAILARHFGLYSLNACRIVYVILEQVEVDRFGFAYGTLTEHGESGEERFSVEFNHANGEVWYDLFAFSRPGHYLTKVGYPLSRYLQKAFAAASLNAMRSAVSDRT